MQLSYPLGTSSADRARVQILAAALNAFSQGIAYFHAGMELLRSKSMDRNSYDSGDWFNRVDWTLQDNFFGSGLPWYWQHHDVRPDIVAFGKKTQVCGLAANHRVDEVDSVFKVSVPVNGSTGWFGHPALPPMPGSCGCFRPSA